MNRVTCVATGLLIVGLAGCATAPKAVRVGDVSTKSVTGIVTYMLPKSAFAVSATWERRTYVPGPLTGELLAWEAESKSLCTADKALSPNSICFWRLSRAMTPAASTIFQCDGNDGAVISLVSTADPVLSISASWDTEQHFAILLAKQAFQASELQVDFSPFGTLGGYSAKSTSLIAETVEKVATEVAGQVLFDPTEPEIASVTDDCANWRSLCALVKRLAALEAGRSQALRGSDPKGASGVIDEQIKALRALAEGTERTGPFSIRIAVDPATKASRVIANVTPDGQASAKSSATYDYAEDASIAKKLRCMDGFAEAKLTFRLDAKELEEKAIERVEVRSAVNSPALYYRLPVPASPSLSITCSGARVNEASRCTAESGGFKTGFPTVVVPQWGPTLALPRTLGWRSGALAAKLDPLTGALISLNASSQGALEASVLNGLYAADVARRAAEKADAGKDHERAALERERVLLEEQVKICAARRALGQPLGDACPG